MTTAQEVIAQAERWVGFVEAPTNRTPFGRWYGMDGQPYCAMALSMWSHDAGLPTPASTSKGYAFTPAGANWFKARGRWGTTPRKGAHVFFQFSGPRIHHVGLVTKVNDGSIDTIEANTSRGAAGSQRDGGGVWRRRRAAGIVGYGYPNYEESEEDEMADYTDQLNAIEENTKYLRSAAFAALQGAVRSAFDSHDQPIATDSEDAARRIERIADDLAMGRRSWAEFERSLARMP